MFNAKHFFEKKNNYKVTCHTRDISGDHVIATHREQDDLI